ncbi:MAG TPA: twin-arginine translocation signal domain-containing protein [Pyrinomonadaceae bacterium]|nr:twin-arginine translocation signal domain-containing protein [Pyrinomonadaceae bacterium]
MALSRRKFVGAVGAGAVGLTAGANVFGQMVRSLGGPAIPVASTTDALTYLSADQFSPLVGTQFSARTAAGRHVTLKLIEVSDLTLKENVSQGFTGESYSLLFECGSKTLPSEIYNFDNRFLGKFNLFVSPVGPHRNRYEAIVSRISQ